MKRKIIALLFMVFALSGCVSSPEGFSKVQNVPSNIQEFVDPEMTLQVIADEGEGYYIVFHSSGDVESELETQDDTLLIKLTETNLQENNIRQHTYYLSTNPETEVMEVLVNGYSTPFDNITVQ